MDLEKFLLSFMTQKRGPDQTPANFEDLIRKKLDEEPVAKRFLLDPRANGAMIFIATAGTSIISNMFYRRALLVYEGAFVSYVINTGVASFMNIIIQVGHFQPKVIRGDYDCQLCCGLRGSFNQVILGYGLTNLLCLASTSAVSQKFDLQQLPSFFHRDSFRSFWRPRLLSIARKSRPLLIMHAVFGAAMAFKQHEIVEEATRKVTRTEYQETVNHMLKELAV